ncbi:MAG: hypothetical protein OEY49_09920 [Candidatus Heimdallarchaeota archaeon]|nr:hypothetical protein [Candidatus Heimdallarchaeota archaeon]
MKNLWIQNNKETIIIMILACIIRIPRNLRLAGNDAFLVSHYAILVSNGLGGQFLVHPLSYFGLYPLSSYPILTSLIVAFFLILNFNLFFSWLLTDLTLVIFGTLFLNNLGKKIYDSKISQQIFLLFFLISPMYVLYSMGSISTRATLITILPLFFSINISILRKPNLKYFLTYTISFLLLLLSHRVGMLFFPLWLLTIFNSILKTIFDFDLVEKLYNTLSYVPLRILYLFNLISFIGVSYLSTFLFNAKNEQLVGTSGIFSYDDHFGRLIELFIDQSLRQGIVVVFAFLLVCYRILTNDFDTGYNSKFIKYEISSFIFIIASSIGIGLPWYVTMLYLLPTLVISTNCFEKMYSLYKNGSKFFLLANLTLLVSYSAITIIYIPKIKKLADFNFEIFLFILFFSVIILTFSHVQIKNIHSKSLISVIIIIIICLNQVIFYTNTLTIAQNQEFPYPYVSDDEIEVSEFLVSLNHDGRFLASNYLIAKRLMGLTGELFYEDQFGGTSLISGYATNEDLVNIQLKPIYDWWSGVSIYEYNQSLVLKYLKEEIFNSSPWNPKLLNLFLLEKTQYVIITREYTFKSEWVEYKSRFIVELLLGKGELVFETTFLMVYKLIFLPDNMG